ncbi:RHS repeat-associated core domain-containing protein [Pseudomonas faucium]|uniref:RHS repeat-associated core domain-containing protein n=1 Tax=Pseudomonas faucium TaxID=2740518 RepID=UPI0015964B13|nr:RHS repeat-associated core domain-containing protein [Pseudomonas faucium]
MMSSYFYKGGSVASVLQEVSVWSWLYEGSTPLAALHNANANSVARLYVTDFANSVMLRSGSYTVYGFLRPHGLGASPLLLYTGQRFDNLSGLYFLGNGHRAFNPSLARFCSADEHSPFGLGGINAYMYCGGDPVNKSDPSGRFGRRLLNLLKGNGYVKNNKKAKITALKAELDELVKQQDVYTNSGLYQGAGSRSQLDRDVIAREEIGKLKGIKRGVRQDQRQAALDRLVEIEERRVFERGVLDGIVIAEYLSPGDNGNLLDMLNYASGPGLGVVDEFNRVKAEALSVRRKSTRW